MHIKTKQIFLLVKIFLKVDYDDERICIRAFVQKINRTRGKSEKTLQNKHKNTENNRLQYLQQR